MKRACQARNTLPVPTPHFNKSRRPGEGGACLEITMSTFAVFGMTRDVALAEAKKRVKTSKPGKPGAPLAADASPVGRGRREVR